MASVNVMPHMKILGASSPNLAPTLKNCLSSQKDIKPQAAKNQFRASDTYKKYSNYHTSSKTKVHLTSPNRSESSNTNKGIQLQQQISSTKLQKPPGTLSNILGNKLSSSKVSKLTADEVLPEASF